MTTKTITLTEEQFKTFHLDEERAKLRSEVAPQFSVSDEIHVLSPDGELWDSFSGSLPDDGAVMLSDEEVLLRHSTIPKDSESESESESETETEPEALSQTPEEENELLESAVRKVMKRLLVQAREEVKLELAAKANEIIRLRTELVKLRASKSEVES